NTISNMNGVRRLIIWRGLALLFALAVLVYSLVRAHYLVATVAVPLCVWLFLTNFYTQLRIYRELEEFAEVAKYRDFTRVFRTKGMPRELRPMYETFNNVNAILRKISSDREVQYQYLQQILDVVDTGMFSYDKESGQVIWMSKAFRDLFGIPHLSHFSALNKRNAELYRHTVDLAIGNASLYT